MTHYIPVHVAAGKVVGAFFVGLEFTEGLKTLEQSILAIKVLVSTSHVEENRRGADTAVSDIAVMAVAILLAALSSGFLVTRHWVARPLQELGLAADRITACDLSGRLSTDIPAMSKMS